MRRQYSILLPAVVLTLLLLVCACARRQSDRPSLAVSIAPQKYLLERIVGDRYDIVTLLSAGADPETYDPSATSLLALQKSDMFFRVGTIGFEQAALGKIAENIPGLRIVNCSAGIPLVQGTHGSDRSNDPHVWVSVKNARIMARNMYEALMKQPHADHRYFTANYNRLDSELAQLDSTLTVMLAPQRGKSFAIKHPSLSYFARDYGLNQLSLELDGKEPSPAQMQQRIDQVRQADALVFFMEKGHANDASRNIASSLGIPVVEISLLDYDWKNNIIAVASALATGDGHQSE